MDYEDYLDEQLFGDEHENMDEYTSQENDGTALSTGAKEGGEDETLKNVWESSKDVAEKKAPRVTKPRPKLTEREMISSKGLPALLALFDNYKPSDKLTPYENVNQILNKVEYWAHGLFPQLKFDDFLEKVEHIGRKRLVQASLQKLRCGMSLDDELCAGNDDVKGDDDEPPMKTAEELFDDFYDDDAFPMEAMNVATKDTKNVSQKAASRPDSEPEMDDDEFEEQLRNIFGKRDVGDKKPSHDDDKHVDKASPLRSSAPTIAEEAEEPWEESLPAGDASPPPPPSADDLSTSAKRRKTIVDSDSDEEPPFPDRYQRQLRVTVDSDEENGGGGDAPNDLSTASGQDGIDAPRKSRLNAAMWSDDDED